MIPCIDGVPAIRVAALLLALIEMFYVSVVGVVIPRSDCRYYDIQLTC